MRKYKSAIYKHLHEEMQHFHAVGDISAEKLADFESRCFKLSADTPQGRATQAPAMATAGPGPGHRIKG